MTTTPSVVDIRRADDRAAFETHLKTPHLAAFEAASKNLVTKKTVIAGDLVCEGSKGWGAR